MGRQQASATQQASGFGTPYACHTSARSHAEASRGCGQAACCDNLSRKEQGDSKTRRSQQERTWSPHHLYQMRKAAAQAQAMHQNQQRTWSPASWRCGSTPPPPLCGTASTPPAPAPGSLRRQGRAQAVHGVSHSPTCLVQAGRGLDLEPAAHAFQCRPIGCHKRAPAALLQSCAILLSHAAAAELTCGLPGGVIPLSRPPVCYVAAPAPVPLQPQPGQ